MIAPLPPSSGSRLIAIDLARTAALTGMAMYHFVYDLTMFGWLPEGTAVTGFWALFARAVAGSFIFLAGVSLWLAHGRGIRWPAFWRRFARIAAGAAVVTVGTYFAFPQYFVFYGILHSIAVSSLIGLAFLRLPAGITLAAAVVAYFLPDLWRSSALDGPLAFIGLFETRPLTVDFLPIFPWLAPMLCGVAVGRIAERLNLWPRLAPPDTLWLRRLSWPGRHSLAIYLVHQPVLIGLVWAGTWLLR
ncbi:DUF1624 domain-containing protein [Neotabrizicola shimadae]|uniref:DUF1624 domain-containing protein n=1 Tax=Neotabrizicola shimadae TaxID=2807096 RepID=A0A8G0ZS01_9RHOB|nr:heparan-alpha-glucosaminide N-acetyltransferase [Neotabrizicola shimadae]QYZ68405.1 DUF1624 domain-containing protein [Neotabrizicola shimadae]